MCGGDNIGITLAESPLIRKCFIKIKPKCINDVAICLSLIRPAAKDARIFDQVEDMEDSLVFDDDAIDIIAKKLNCSDDEADKLRRSLIKGNKEIMNEIKKIGVKPFSLSI